MSYDYTIIGAGIVGAALAREIKSSKPGARVAVVEKESRAAFHQTGRNSGVVHSGVYYPPDSLKTQFCREGMAHIKAFCASRGLPYQERGKLLVATDEYEEKNLCKLQQRAESNNVRAMRLSQAELHQCEPEISGIAALRIPSTAITSYSQITNAMLGEVENKGGHIFLDSPLHTVTESKYGYKLAAGAHSFETGRLVACAGLTSDRVAKLLGINFSVRIVPFKGEYFVLPKKFEHVVHHLIYPVPDPQLPFLGVHLTPMVDGTVTVGPNAVLSLAREKYGRFNINFSDAASALLYPGLWRLLAKYPRAIISELKGSLLKSAYLENVNKYCKTVTLPDLKVHRSGNRAQALRADGRLVDDFLIKSKGGVTAVLNAPSPAATGSIPIAKKIAADIIG